MTAFPSNHYKVINGLVKAAVLFSSYNIAGGIFTATQSNKLFSPIAPYPYLSTYKKGRPIRPPFHSNHPYPPRLHLHHKQPLYILS